MAAADPGAACSTLSTPMSPLLAKNETCCTLLPQDDPELKPMFDEIREGGMPAMMK